MLEVFFDLYQFVFPVFDTTTTFAAGQTWPTTCWTACRAAPASTLCPGRGFQPRWGLQLIHRNELASQCLAHALASLWTLNTFIQPTFSFYAHCFKVRWRDMRKKFFFTDRHESFIIQIGGCKLHNTEPGIGVGDPQTLVNLVGM